MTSRRRVACRSTRLPVDPSGRSTVCAPRNRRRRTHIRIARTMAIVPGMLATIRPAITVVLINATSVEGDGDWVVREVVGGVLLAGDRRDLDMQQPEGPELDRACLRPRNGNDQLLAGIDRGDGAEIGRASC